MSKIDLTVISIQDLIYEIQRRGLITNSKSNKVILDELETLNEIHFILSKGYPKEKMECRECRNFLESKSFSYYLSRVDQNGFFWRSNALCNDCATHSNKSRKKVLDNAKIPSKPKKGDKCTNCDREWNGKWHRHHEGDEFIKWLCGHCNTHLSDQRNKLISS